MDWTQYLKQTDSRLRDYPDDIRQAMIDDLYIYIRDERRKHVPDSVIAETLGTPKDTADSLRMLYGDPNQYPRAGTRTSSAKDTAEAFRETWDSFTDFVHDTFQSVQSTVTGYTPDPPVMPMFFDTQPDTISILSYRADLQLTILPGEELAGGFSAKHSLFSSPSARIEQKEKDTSMILRISSGKNYGAPAALVLHVPDWIRQVQIDSYTGNTIIRSLQNTRILLKQSSGTIHLEDLRNTALTVQAAKASIEAVNIHAANAFLGSKNGNITCTFFHGPLETRTTHGAITVSGHEDGMLKCRSAKGSQNLETRADTVEAVTTGGHIRLHINGLLKTARMHSLSGNIEAFIPEDIGTIWFRTSRGRLRNESDLPVYRLPYDEPRPAADDYETIDIRTRSGKVRIF